ncbi:glycosyltransferase family 2 protein, partial [Anaerosporobacter sp.]
MGKTKKKVLVLLSTYNGEQYIIEQLDSIMNQSYPNIEVLVRDDGSSDNTVSIIKEYIKSHNRVRLYCGTNLGVQGSFFDLLKKAPIDRDYYAFCDQDDVWLEEKVEKAVTILEQYDRDFGFNEPKLYCSKVQCVNNELQPISTGISYKRVRISLGNALVENMCIGCTSMLNQALVLKILHDLPSFSIMHDFWIYLVASTFGRVIYDDNAYILYRQHENNVVGMSSTKYKNYLRRIHNYRKHQGQLTKQAQEFLDLYDDIPNEKVELIKLLL